MFNLFDYLGISVQYKEWQNNLQANIDTCSIYDIGSNTVVLATRLKTSIYTISRK
jgi:hypothetical protein